MLSAIVISRNDEDRIEEVVRAVVEQETPEPFEVIVVNSGTDRTAEIVRERFPSVRLVALDHPALPGEARNAGLRLARGEFISFPGSHVELPPGSLAARIRAHQAGHAMVTGTTLNGTPTRAGWATYFLDHASVLPGRPSARLTGPPAHCSYLRDHLELVGGFPEDMRAGEDTVVNVELSRRGLHAYRAQDVTIIHHSRCTTLPRLLRHHLQRGRGMGRILLEEHGPRGRVVRRVVRPFGIEYLGRRVGAVSRHVRQWGGELRPRYRRAYPYVVLGATAALAGTWAELLRPERGKLRVLFGGGTGAPPARQTVAPGTPAARAAERFPVPIDVHAYLDARGADEAEGRLTYATVLEGAESPAATDGTVALLGVSGTGALEELVGPAGDPERALDGLVDRVRAGGFGGLSLHFPDLPAERREAYAELLRRAGDRLRAEDLLLASLLASGAHDRSAHAEACDLVVLAPPAPDPAAGPAPVAPLPALRQRVQNALADVPREKLLLALPLGGYEWRPGEAAPRSVPAARAAELGARPGAVTVYDERAECPSVRLVADGGEHVVWFEDARSLTAKADLVRSFGLRGVSPAGLADAFAGAWRVLGDVFTVRRAPGSAPEPRSDGVPAED